MAIQEITKHWILTCDICGTTTTQTGTHRPSKWVSVDIGADAVDMYGSAAADASRKLLFCHDCGVAIVSAINAAGEKLKAK